MKFFLMRSLKVMRAGTGNKKFFIWPDAYAMLKIAYLKRAYIWLKIHGFIQFPFEMALQVKGVFAYF